MNIDSKSGKRRGPAALGLLLAACAATPAPDGPAPPAAAAREEQPTSVRIHSLLGAGARSELAYAPIRVGAPTQSRNSSMPLVGARSPAPEGLGAAPRTTLAGEVNSTLLASLRIDGAESVREVMRFISAASGIDILVEQQAEDAVLGAGLELHVKRDRPITVKNALNLIVELAEHEIAWTLRDGVVIVTTPDRARGAPRTVVHDVSDLVRGITSYPGRRMDVAPSGGLTPFDEDLGEPAPVIHEDLLIQLIMDSIDPDGWDRPGNSVTIRDGKLIVSHD